MYICTVFSLDTRGKPWKGCTCTSRYTLLSFHVESTEAMETMEIKLVHCAATWQILFWFWLVVSNMFLFSIIYGIILPID